MTASGAASSRACRAAPRCGRPPAARSRCRRRGPSALPPAGRDWPTGRRAGPDRARGITRWARGGGFWGGASPLSLVIHCKSATNLHAAPSVIRKAGRISRECYKSGLTWMGDGPLPHPKRGKTLPPVGGTIRVRPSPSRAGEPCRVDPRRRHQDLSLHGFAAEALPLRTPAARPGPFAKDRARWIRPRRPQEEPPCPFR